MYYAYVHAKPMATDATGIFYVGKGKERRCLEFDRVEQNPYYARTVAKYGTPLVGKMECSSEKIAFDLERGLIKCIRRMGVVLTNLSDGGEGQSGYRHTAHTKDKIGAKHLGKKRLESTKNKIREKFVSRVNPAQTVEGAAKISEAMTGRVWITNGVKDRNVILTVLPVGWRFGRTHFAPSPNSAYIPHRAAADSVWVVNADGKSFRTFERNVGTYLANGFIRGRKWPKQ